MTTTTSAAKRPQVAGIEGHEAVYMPVKGEWQSATGNANETAQSAGDTDQAGDARGTRPDGVHAEAAD